MALLRGLALGLGLVLLLAGGAAATSIGEPAPAVDLTTLRGGSFDLGELRGRVVVLDFWATWCSLCVEQLRSLEALARRVSPADVAIVVVSIDDDAGRAERFLAQRFAGAGFRRAHDPGGAALSSFGAGSIPALYVLDREGILRLAHFGAGGAAGVAGEVAALVVEGRPTDGRPAGGRAPSASARRPVE